MAPGTVSLTGDRAQGDDSKHDSHYTVMCALSFPLFMSFNIYNLGRIIFCLYKKFRYILFCKCNCTCIINRNLVQTDKSFFRYTITGILISILQAQSVFR